MLCVCRFYNLFATDIMRVRLDFLSYQSTFHDLHELLNTTEHDSYPLVDAPGQTVLWVAIPVQVVCLLHMEREEEKKDKAEGAITVI